MSLNQTVQPPQSEKQLSDTARPEKSQSKLKTSLHNVHLWLGLITGLFAFLLCLSGTVLVLQAPVENWINRDVLVVQATEQQVPITQLLSQAPDLESLTGLTIPADPNAAWALQAGRESTYINPYTGEVLGGMHQATHDFFMVWFRLHRWLLFDSEIGRPITGAATLCFLLISLTGLYLWLNKALRQPRRTLPRLLALKRKVGWRRQNYDLHLVLGIYAVIPLLIMAYSGLFWSYREPFVKTHHLVLNGQNQQEREKPTLAQNREPISKLAIPYAQIIATTTKLYPYPGDLSLRLPEKASEPLEITKTNRSHFWSMPARDKWYADPQTGQVLQELPFAQLSRAEQYLGLIKAIHIGTLFNNLSLWIYFLAALIGTSLPLTGALHWGQRLFKQRQRRILAEAQRSAPSN